jgi:glycosyltransferase involved in cell wall biosynthesis
LSSEITAEYAFTIFTATYNRAATLPRVLAALQRQTYRNFEWVIVDDGSTDNTRELVADWMARSVFPIRYIFQEHAHKKTAFNRGVREARGTLFVNLDSDDECGANALERFWWHWNNIPADAREGFSAVTALCSYEDGTLVGSRFSAGDYLDSDSIEVVRRWHVTGDKWGFQRVDVLRQFPYPEDVRGHVPEGIVWTRIAEEYKTRFVNEVLAIVHKDGAGAPRLSAGRSPSADAPGSLLLAESVFQRQWRYFRYDPLYFAHCAINFTRFSLHSGHFKMGRAANLPGSALLFALMPAGLAAYLLDLCRERSL